MSAVFILSDFGLSDTYVGQMRSVLYCGTPPGTALIDLTHDVGRGDVLEGAFHLFAAAPHLPDGSVVLAVVDPGVGTDRRAVVVRSGGLLIVGPDNGIFGLLPADEAWKLPAPGGSCSTTFHGRDLFAPAAARLASDPGWTGSLQVLETDSLAGLGIDAALEEEGVLRVTVAHVDVFGNVILWLSTDDTACSGTRGVILADGRRLPLTRTHTYSGGEGLLLLEGSLGLMEIAVDGGSAGDILGVSTGGKVRLVNDP